MGLALAAMGFALFTVMDSLVKWLTQSYPLFQITFFNSLFALLTILILILVHDRGRSLFTRHLRVHLLRSTFGTLSGLTAFYAYSRMPLADAYAVGFATPLLITALSVPVLGEVVGWRRWSAVLVGFAGVLVMLRPGAGLVDLGAAAALAGALFHACGVLVIRRCNGVDGALTFAFYGSLVGVAVSGSMATFVWQPVAWADLPPFILCGVTGAVALVAFTSAYRRAPAAVVAPFQYTQLLWGCLAGWLVWGDLPDGWTVGGGAIVVASGLYILHREHLIRTGRARPEPLRKPVAPQVPAE